MYTPFPSSATILCRTPRRQQRTAQTNGGGTCYTTPLSPCVAQISVRTYYCRRPRGGSIMDRAWYRQKWKDVTGGRPYSFHHNGQVYKQRHEESRRRPATMAFKVGHSSSQHFVTFSGSVLRCLTTFASSETQREELGVKHVAYARSGVI